MIWQFFSKRFSLTQEGAKNLVKGVTYTALLNISLMLPVGLYVFLLYEFLNPLLNGQYIAPDLGLFIVLILIILGIIFALEWKQYYYVYNTVYGESEQKRINLAESLRKLPLSFFENKDLSDLTSTTMNDCTELEHAFSHAIPHLIGSIVALILIAIGLLFFDYRLAIALLWVVPVAFGLTYAARKFQRKGEKQVIKSKLVASDGIQECLESIRDIKSYNYQNKYLKELNRKIGFIEKSKMKSELMAATGVISGTMVLKLGMVSVMIAGAYMILQGQISIFTFLIFLIAASSVYIPVENSLIFLAEIFGADLKIERMDAIENQSVDTGLTSYHLDNYNISFEDVDFSYDTSKQVLQDLNFTANQGEVTALIGPSGGGKSTVSKLVAKFWNPTSGVVSLGGVNLAEVDSEKVLENFSIVFQDVILFNNSVLENIRIGRKDATDEEVIEAARIAECEEFVKDLPEGYNTLIGENGSLLSGGQRQRISIARAILKDAPVILLDEATSFLDVENESKIQKALSNLIKDKTVLVIAHRMRTIANADKIVVLEKGRIVEQGSPKELYESKGLFYKLFSLQQESKGWKL